MTLRTLAAALLGTAALLVALPDGASAQTYMATRPATGMGIGTEQYFTPWDADDYGRLYFAPASLNGIKLIVAADLSYWPQWHAGVAPSPPPQYSRNAFFSWPAQYQIDCGENIWIFLNQSKLCRAVNIPVVTADQKDAFLAGLSGAGLNYNLVYPIKDNGNGRGYVVWTSMEGINSGSTTGPNMPTQAGYARIEGIGWRNQFQPTNLYGMLPRPYGDTAGAFINGLPSPRRETTLRLVTPMISNTIGTTIYGTNATMVTDDWLAGTSTPPTPPVPPTPLTPPAPPARGALANPTNAGSPSNGSSSGDAGDGGQTETNGAAFDWNSYCQSPNPDGSPRTLGWIENCLATRH
jgi:hypothetical protein